ncbi:MAG: PorT family protein [Bacteroidetes bacterium]|nr:PorT family protein [Bacteroidota bacterium]
MRKLIIILVFFLTCPKLTKAQDEKFHFGLKITPSMAWIKPDRNGLKRDGYKLGFAYGVQTEFSLQKNYAIATGVQVAYRGGKIRFEAGNDSSGNPLADPVINFKLQYVEIPVCLKMLTNQFNKTRYYGMFGFSPSFLIRSKKDSDEEDNISAKDDFNIFNMNMIIGAGVEYTLSGSTVAFGGLEFNNGFFDIFDGDGAKGVTNYLGLNVGILF